MDGSDPTQAGTLVAFGDVTELPKRPASTTCRYRLRPRWSTIGAKSPFPLGRSSTLPADARRSNEGTGMKKLLHAA